MSIYALRFPIFLPAMRVITAITNSTTALVTTSFANQYISGEIVRIVMPFSKGYYPWGMKQIDNLTGTIEVINDTQFYIDIDTTYFEPFVTPSIYYQVPCVVPIGQINSMLTASTRNILNPS